jgi:hypothetical protein
VARRQFYAYVGSFAVTFVDDSDRELGQTVERHLPRQRHAGHAEVDAGSSADECGRKSERNESKYERPSDYAASRA